MGSPPRAYAYAFAAAHADSWFDVHFLYVRITNSQNEECSHPEVLTMRLLPHDIAICLELNGARIPPSEEANLSLRRSPMKPEGGEALMYVSTDNLRTSSTIQFQVLDGDALLISGAMSCTGSSNGRWTITTVCEVGAQGCAFVKGRHVLSKQCASVSFPSNNAAIEVCVVGRTIGETVILEKTLQLTARRRSSSASLNAIPENDEVGKVSLLTTQLTFLDEQGELAESASESTDISVKQKVAAVADFNGIYDIYDSSLYNSDSDQEETWYNRGISTGIKLGLGFGLGMCLGIGIGVGLIIRTYRATSKSMNKGLIPASL